jgi:hypothetical protein
MAAALPPASVIGGWYALDAARDPGRLVVARNGQLLHDGGLHPRAAGAGRRRLTGSAPPAPKGNRVRDSGRRVPGAARPRNAGLAVGQTADALPFRKPARCNRQEALAATGASGRRRPRLARPGSGAHWPPDDGRQAPPTGGSWRRTPARHRSPDCSRRHPILGDQPSAAQTPALVRLDEVGRSMPPVRLRRSQRSSMRSSSSQAEFTTQPSSGPVPAR